MSSSGCLMVVGATSGAGKSTVSAGLCRWLRRNGHRVAPFKAQNMSNHAAVTADGGEIGRAQAMQAAAAGIDFERRMNPILLKPTSGNRSHIVVLGEERDLTTATGYGPTAEALKPVVFDALASLRRDFDWVVAEGAGGAAEINLLDRDLVNLPLAYAAGIPAILVVDIERGGAFASAFGTIEILPQHLKKAVAGIVFNQFRGDPALLERGSAAIEQRTGVPILGVLPYLEDGPLLGVEDSLDLWDRAPRPTRSPRPVRVVAIRLPHIGNPSDLDPFLIEDDVTFSWATTPDHLESADLVVIPGSRATVDDLDWMRTQGLDRTIVEIAASSGVTLVGICAGYQMLGTRIDDTVESKRGTVPGLGLLPSTTTFMHPKIVRRSAGTAGGIPVAGYQMRFGRPESTGDAWLMLDGEPEGAISGSGSVLGTSLHGIFDNDALRTAVLTEVAAARDREYSASERTFTQAVEVQHERLADWLEESLDLAAICQIGATATPPANAPGWY